MSILTPNMSLNQPTIGVDTGLTWETQVNANASLIDQHNHSFGEGVQINPNGLNINADLQMGINNLTLTRSVRFSPQPAPIALATDLDCVYVSGVDLWYNDGNGNQVKLTSAGAVNSTVSGITSGSATASFVSSVLVVNSASNTPADIQGASILLGNVGVSGSKYLTLQPPSAMGSNYSLTLPSLPASQSFVTLDNSGNFSAPTTYPLTGAGIANGAIGTTQLAAGSVTTSILGASAVNTANINPGAVTQGVRAAATIAGNFTASFSTGSTSPVNIIQFTLVTNGRPLWIVVQPTTGAASTLGVNNNPPGYGTLQMILDSTNIGIWQFPYTGYSAGGFAFPTTLINGIAAGSHLFSLQAFVSTGGTTFFGSNLQFSAVEL